MVLDLQGKRTSAGTAIVVDYLATNPANRASSRGLKHVGIALMSVAAMRSIQRDASGRIWLESLPGAASFYESLGMSRQSGRSAEDNLIYVLESATADQLLEKIKENGIVKL